ncbi:TPA: IdeS/Mac family cysteine endopeptidase [Streptococcus equi subsp. zooepidemicus]|uniref:IdeS/Mac family cysteine endopeptidase n=1 Tax=Streptococcus equi TaxID=1336 RepID=UPI0013F671FC|nr:IdeS/Mac family cysteine endopeptidase [Streptococcus equi]QUF63271.1 IdeS/Mac family cysteine endopeptidase [Streptococcus equi subsp. zooepidemicus]QWN61869.1 IdeS/Mac family cysteine endopeptidase [Streptococcus equi subsp. zooepidemicus]HEL0792182.1 IdeS/Mac family cysteine endopeptidase [Streptococcus equi subsp. zooepidemicus]HEL0796074.1 IdeS/Mac family cysteine endopeptidase [Streptococcus equi subsp. zooepidemicus]HEL1187579.1 IdeS/Mac family cysteine endopeptidase [Streptococcus e
MMKKQSFTHSRKPKFGMRKLSIGLASCMLGMMFLTTSHVSGEVVEVWPYGQDPNDKIEVLSQSEYSEYLQRLHDVEDFQAEKKKEGVVRTQWLEGVNVTDHDFRKITDGGSVYYATPLLNDRGYYDINKNFNQDSDKCAAAVAVNMFHYWLDRNKDNVAKFLSQSPDHGFVEGEPTFNLVDFQYTYASPYEEGGYRDNSKLFDFISKAFNKPLWANKLLDAYINGYGYIDRYVKNTPHSGQNNSKFNFFKKVFDGKLLTDIQQIFDYYTLSSELREALGTGKAIGLAYGPGDLRRSLGHIISVWGADINEDGNVVAIYVTDSDDKKLTIGNKKDRIGLKRYKLYSDNVGRARLTAYATENQQTGGEVRGIETLDMATQDWADYFSRTDEAEQ